ncbi:carboxymuconolactone decarboxylase family protein [Parahaliea aestuarii]|uniref:Carboxymuconolactone decarboxylase family protein n=1 Tax=Parahaliea aestuarii TaxID=1852021 RepID=A0A5C8ZME0_9GAMM|nr:carboxymuconolactone decarboxylase family protein [Parahaliea aestuarii]TXS89618.1 carboxymuconolactone decarboxylase family protein [Parahaliea aestuarii]
MTSQPRAHGPGTQSGDPVRDSALALVPEILEAYIPLSRAVWLEGPLGPALLEMVRLRNAQRVNCVFCRNARYDIARDDGLTEEKIGWMASEEGREQLSEQERLAVAFADAYLEGPDNLSSDLQAELAAAFSPAEIAHLSLALLLFNTFSRCAVTIGGMPDSLPVMEVSLPPA